MVAVQKHNQEQGERSAIQTLCLGADQVHRSYSWLHDPNYEFKEIYHDVLLNFAPGHQ